VVIAKGKTAIFAVQTGVFVNKSQQQTGKSIFVVEMEGYPQTESNYPVSALCWHWIKDRKLSPELEVKCEVVEYVRKN